MHAEIAAAAMAHRNMSAMTFGRHLVIIKATAAEMAIATGLKFGAPSAPAPHQHIEPKAQSAQSISATDAGLAPRMIPRTTRFSLNRSRDLRTK